MRELMKNQEHLDSFLLSSPLWQPRLCLVYQMHMRVAVMTMAAAAAVAAVLSKRR